MTFSGVPALALAIVAALILATLAGLAAMWPTGSLDDELPEGLRTATVTAEIVGVRSVSCQVPQTTGCLRIESRLTAGAEAGSTVTFSAGGTPGQPQFDVGDRVRLARNAPEAAAQGLDPYSFSDYERRSPMLWLLGGFAMIVLVFGRLRGALALIGLAASVAVITMFLIPSMLDGHPPLLVALTAASAVMFVTLALAHGVGPKSLAAALGTAASLLLTAALAVLFVELANITGFSSEEVLLLQDAADRVSIQGLVLAGMVIGALGVLDDVTVSQASTVLALRRADPTLRLRELYRSAIEVGRDHVAATVNTLVLAYVGASLPVLLVFSVGDLPFGDAINREAVSEQIIGTLVGSIGLIAAVPLTTAVAALLATRMTRLPAPDAHGHHH